MKSRTDSPAAGQHRQHLALSRRNRNDQIGLALVNAVLHAPGINQAITLGDLASYSRWKSTRGIGRDTLARTREKLFQRILSAMNEIYLIVEFGVAYGDAARWWLETVLHERLEYIGFDSFDGMPAPYRQLPAGVFDLGGVPPDIQDSRVSWRVGLVEETLKDFEFPDRMGPRLFYV